MATQMTSFPIAAAHRSRPTADPGKQWKLAQISKHLALIYRFFQESIFLIRFLASVSLRKSRNSTGAVRARAPFSQIKSVRCGYFGSRQFQADISRSILAKKVSFMNGLGGGFSTLIDVVSFSNEIISKNRIIVDDYARVSSTPSKWVK